MWVVDFWAWWGWSQINSDLITFVLDTLGFDGTVEAEFFSRMAVQLLLQIPLFLALLLLIGFVNWLNVHAVVRANLANANIAGHGHKKKHANKSHFYHLLGNAHLVHVVQNQKRQKHGTHAAPHGNILQAAESPDLHVLQIQEAVSMPDLHDLPSATGEDPLGVAPAPGATPSSTVTATEGEERA